MIKTKYLVKLNWYGEVHKIYTSSTLRNGALLNAFYQLAEKTGYNKGFIKLKFLGDKDNFKIIERKSNDTS
jgi:hypothetical protein